MSNRPRTLGPVQHAEVPLMPIEISQKNQTSLVVVSRSLKYMPRKSHSRSHQLLILPQITRIQSPQSQSRRWSNAIEDPQQSIAMPHSIAANQLGIVEVVSRIHPNPRRQKSPHRNLTIHIQQRDLDSIDLRPVIANHAQTSSHPLIFVTTAPIPLH